MQGRAGRSLTPRQRPRPRILEQLGQRAQSETGKFVTVLDVAGVLEATKSRPRKQEMQTKLMLQLALRTSR
jgi:hypothetical protein